MTEHTERERTVARWLFCRMAGRPDWYFDRCPESVQAAYLADARELIALTTPEPEPVAASEVHMPHEGRPLPGPASLTDLPRAAPRVDAEPEPRYHIYMDGELVTANAPVQDHPDSVGGSIVRRSCDAAPAPESGALEALRMLDRRFRLVRVVSQSKDPDRAVCDYEATLTLTERVRIERLAARKEG